MSINGEKITLLIPRLASEFDGEIVATVHAIRRLLDASGYDLHDLARVVAGSPQNASSRKMRPPAPLSCLRSICCKAARG
jgi:hypothetical protein